MSKYSPVRRGLLPGILAIVLLCGSAVLPSNAADGFAASADQAAPLQAGERAPRFVVRTVEDAAYEFNPDALEKPVVLITFRGGWCPYCNLHLSELHTVIPELRAMGIDVLFLSGDRPELLYASLTEETQAAIAGRDYTLYSDADMHAGLALGIAFSAEESTIRRRLDRGQDIAASSMVKHHALSVPSVFAIDKTGVIRFSFAEPNYKVRLPTETLLAVAQDLVK